MPFTIRLIEITFCFCFIILVFNTIAYGQGKGQVTIYRDTYGVLHIYGDTEESVAYGHRYAQAEDRLGTLLKAYRKAEGTMAEAFGAEFIEHDYQQRVLRHAEVNEHGVSYARSGQSCPTVVFLKQPIKSYSAVPYGQSEHPDSPHYTDQAEKLFKLKKLKPMWFQKEELLQNLKSKKTLIVP